MNDTKNKEYVKQTIEDIHRELLVDVSYTPPDTLKRILRGICEKLTCVCDELKENHIYDYRTFVEPARIVTYIQYDESADFISYESTMCNSNRDFCIEDTISIAQFYKDMHDIMSQYN